jgi:hypothetical protein
MAIKFHYQVGRLQGDTLKLGEYKINALGSAVSMASLMLNDGFIYGLPRLIETKDTMAKTSDRSANAQYTPINYRVDLPVEVCSQLKEVLLSLRLVGGDRPWTSQYVLILEVSDRIIAIENENSLEYQAFYRRLFLLDNEGSIIFRHNPKPRRGKNRKNYN